MRWYSTSVSVWAGATVIDSPVCTPIASTILDRADHDDVVRVVAHDLELVFLPTDHAALDEDLGDRAGRETALGDALHLAVVVRDAGAAPAEDERRAHDHRIADLGRDRERLVDRVGNARRRHAQADLAHRGLEPLPILGSADRVDARADHLDVVRVEHAGFVERDRKVETGLATERREERVRALAFDDALE